MGRRTTHAVVDDAPALWRVDSAHRIGRLVARSDRTRERPSAGRGVGIGRRPQRPAAAHALCTAEQQPLVDRVLGTVGVDGNVAGCAWLIPAAMVKQKKSAKLGMVCKVIFVFLLLL